MDFLRGHRIEEINGEWVYHDTKESTVKNWKGRLCGYCGKRNTLEGHDACLGTLDGVMNACCGHGQEKEAYVQFVDGSTIDGSKAINFLNRLKNV